MTLAERIQRITPQYHPGADDLRWYETELERIQDKALPKLIRKRFVDSLRSVGKSANNSRSVTAPVSVPVSTPAKSPASPAIMAASVAK